MFIPVILAGGPGTRLWPISRATHPKPFMRLQDGESLLQKTLARVSHFNDIPEILTVTNRDYYFKIKDEYAAIPNGIKNCFLLEPCARNTAPAIMMAAFYTQEKYGADSILLVLPADHLITEQDIFNQTIFKACELARANQLVTFGIHPTVPETGFGYIKKQASDSKDQTAYLIEKFIEKPNLALAKEYITSGEYLWNSGMFCFKASRILAEFSQLMPEIFAELNTCWDASKGAQPLTDTIEINAKLFANMADISIDYAVMEKAKEVAVVPCDFGWSDIGSWSAVSELAPADSAGNRVRGEALLVNVTNSYVHAENHLVAAIGVDNLIIIDTPDALLVTHKDCSQDVKKIVMHLKQNNHASYHTHRTVFRPWGTYTVLEEGERFKIKRIVVKPGASLSLQIHHHRSEHWVVVSGVARVTNGDHVLMLHTNQSTFIPAGHQHRLENPGLVDLMLIEVQTGEYLGEDDIVRLDDKYGRY